MLISFLHGDNMGKALIFYLVANNILYIELLMGSETAHIHHVGAVLLSNYTAVV